jgi:prevent-host-death family protein
LQRWRARLEGGVKSYSARDAAKKFGALLEDADAGPVEITKSGRRRAVLVSARSWAEYEAAYAKASDDRLLDLLAKSVDLLADGKLGRGVRALALARRLRLNEEKPGDERAAGQLLQREE